METSIGIEPIRHAFAARAARQCCSSEQLSAQRESNPPGSRWQRDALPVGFVRRPSIVRELGNDPSPPDWKPGVHPSTPHARSCSWRLRSPFRLGRAGNPSPPHRGLVERLRRRGRGRHRERRAPVGNRTRTSPIPRGASTIERERWWRCSVTLRVRLLARHARSLLHIPFAGRQRIERCPPGLEAGWPPWPATQFAPRTRIELVPLDRQSSCDTSRITRHCWKLGVTRGIEPPHVGHDHAASPVAQRHHRVSAAGIEPA